jgi:hypothetical protein
MEDESNQQQLRRLCRRYPNARPILHVARSFSASATPAADSTS